MSKTAALFVNSISTNDVSSANSNNAVPTLGDVIFIWVASRLAAGPAAPTVTAVDSSAGVNGFDATITSLGSGAVVVGTPVRVATLFKAVVTAIRGTGSGHFLLDWAGVSQLSIAAQFRKWTGSVGAITVIQTSAVGRGTDTSIDEVTLGAFADVLNATLLFSCWQSDSITVSYGTLTALATATGGNSQALRIASAWIDSNDTTPDGTLSSASNHISFGVEIHEDAGNKTDSDTDTLSEAAALSVAPQGTTDAGTLAEAYVLGLTGTDTMALADVSSDVEAQLPAGEFTLSEETAREADTGSLTEAGTLAETGAVIASVVASEAMALTEGLLITQAGSAGSDNDARTLAEGALIAAVVTAPVDAETLTELALVSAPLTASDTEALTDTGVLFANTMGSDAGTLAEALQLAAVGSAQEGLSFGESYVVGPLTSDDGTLVEAASVTQYIFFQGTAEGTPTIVPRVSGTPSFG